ncbi:MAG TPA: ABC transporter permease [Opitutaceae bacterium]|nr:ABC transporter permease [Opitutaceae bacterium]
MLSDLKYAFRRLARSPGFTAVAVLTLALGIGPNTAIFSFFYGVLLRPLPFDDPDRLVIFQQAPAGSGSIRVNGVGLFAADYLDIRKHSQSLADAATYTAFGSAVTGVGSPDVVGCAVVSDNFFAVLGARAFVGRVFTPEDVRLGSGRLAVLSYDYWRSKFGGGNDAIGRHFAINGVDFVVMGVMPPDYRFPNEAGIYVSPAGQVPESYVGAAAFDANGRGNYLRTIVARLRPGVSVDRAQAELAALVRALPNPNQMNRPVYLVTMRHQTVGQIRPILGTLFGCVGLVLLIACLNIANLLLVRATAQQREMGIRMALGASRWAVACHALTESLLLALFGGVLGVLIGLGGTRLLLALAPTSIPRLAAVRVDGEVLAFALGLSLLTGIAFGLAPALEISSSDPNRALAGASRGGTTGVQRRRLRSTLVAIEVSVSLVLLVAAGLLLRSFHRLQAASWGFESARVISMRVGFYNPRFGEEESLRSVYTRLQAELGAEPGFESVGLSSDLIGNAYWSGPFVPEGHVFRSRAETPVANRHGVSPDYFRTVGIRLIQGRYFTAQDNEHGPPVVIVDSALARKFFSDGQAIGKHIDGAEIVGIVNDVKSNGPEAGPGMDLYFPLSQRLFASAFITIRTTLAPVACVAVAKHVLQQIDPSVPVSNVTTMDDVVAKPALGRRFPLILIGAFAGLALLLASIGIYAVVSYSVAQRTREIGVRMALGAQARGVTRLILRQGAIPIATGLAVGLGASVFTAFTIRKMLFEVPPYDAVTFAAVPALLAAIALFACWIPARRAARVNPIEALRAE